MIVVSERPVVGIGSVVEPLEQENLRSLAATAVGETKITLS
jgi:hypothetical protein